MNFFSLATLFTIVLPLAVVKAYVPFCEQATALNPTKKIKMLCDDYTDLYSCHPENADTYIANFTLSDSKSATVKDVMIVNTAQAPGTTYKQDVVYEFTTGDVVWTYHKQGYGACKLDFSQDTVSGFDSGSVYYEVFYHTS